MELNLKRPLAFFDLETTGINIAKDRIIEISVVKVHPDASEEWFTKRLNPGMPISPQASAIHGIKDEDVKDCPTFREIGKNLARFLEGCDLAGYNAIRFDIPLLAEEFLREEIDFDIRKRKYVDVQVIFHKKEQRTLSAAYMFYCKRELSDAHSAKADTQATYEILKAQIDRYDDLENDIENLSRFSHHNRFADLAGRIIYNSKGQEVFNFGKHKGQPVEEVLRNEPSYFAWMMAGDFPEYTKKVLTEIKLRSFNAG
ncbi:MAG: 3'-5' exonuclease [Bacteroidales bacterium]|nr:3'-5' exonuclease [Bacteroidales bacterium]